MPRFIVSEPAETILASLAEALDLIDVGIVLLDRDMQVRFSNRRFLELWAGQPELPKTGSDFRTMLRQSSALVPYPVAESALPTQIDLRDGRRVLFRCVPCADGGRILTWADITPVKQAQELQEQRARDDAERLTVEARFAAEVLESQAAYLATLAESADENARRVEQANRQLEREMIERRQLEVQLRRLATTDSLTGILNRAQFLALGERELARSRQLGSGLAVMMLDIDHFKLINDRYGHHAGDEALRHFVAQIRSDVRSVDLFGRLGGEEFAIVLPAADDAIARQVAERLRARVATAPLVRADGAISLTVSIGVAMAQATDRTLEHVLARADAGLYAAKDAGRNRVWFAKEPAEMATADKA